MAIAEIPALRSELLTSRWVSIAHLEAVYEIANSLDLLDLHKLLTDFFIQRGLHLQVAGLQYAAPHKQDNGSSQSTEGPQSSSNTQTALEISPSQRFKQVRHPLMKSIIETSSAVSAQSDSEGSDDGLSADDQKADRKRSNSAQEGMLVMAQNASSPGSAGHPRRRGRNSSPASLTAAVSPEAQQALLEEPAEPASAHDADTDYEYRVKARTKSWIVPGGVAHAKSISQRTLIRWRQELQIALANVDASVIESLHATPEEHLNASCKSSGFQITEVGNQDSPRRRSSVALRGFFSGNASAEQTAFATSQLGETPASDYLEQTISQHDSSCPACSSWQLKYNLLRSEATEQIGQLRSAVEQMGTQLSQAFALERSTSAIQKTGLPQQARLGALATVDAEHLVPDLQPPPLSARHSSRLSRLTIPSETGSDASAEYMHGSAVPASTASSDTAELTAAGQLESCQQKLKQQKSSFIAREKRWKDLTAKLTTRLESKTLEVRSLKAQIKKRQLELQQAALGNP